MPTIDDSDWYAIVQIETGWLMIATQSLHLAAENLKSGTCSGFGRTMSEARDVAIREAKRIHEEMAAKA